MDSDQLIRRARRIVVALAMAFACLAGVGTAGVGTAAAAAMPTEGIFENCNLDTEMPACVQRLQVMHQGGMQLVVVPAWSGSLASLTTYAAAARELGMSVMWELSNPAWWQDADSSTEMSNYLPAFAAACGCTENAPLLASVGHWLGALPATYGYYAADDSMLSAGDAAGVAHYVAELKQADPSHTVMIGSADESQAGTYERTADLIGNEIYPVTTDSLMPAAARQDVWGGVIQEAGDDQHIAAADGKQSAFILQAFTWGDNLSDGQTIGACSASDNPLSCYAKLRYPSGAEQLQLRNEILLHAHPKLILWWSFFGTYGSVDGDTYSIYPDPAEAAARWSGLSAAIQAPFPGATSRAQPPPRAHVAAGAAGVAAHKRHRRPKHHKRHPHHKHHRRHHRRRHPKRDTSRA